jgi:hypothetical protein
MMLIVSIEQAGFTKMKMVEKWQERTAKIIQEANHTWNKDENMTMMLKRRKQKHGTTLVV